MFNSLPTNALREERLVALCPREKRTFIVRSRHRHLQAGHHRTATQAPVETTVATVQPPLRKPISGLISQNCTKESQMERRSSSKHPEDARSHHLLIIQMPTSRMPTVHGQSLVLSSLVKAGTHHSSYEQQTRSTINCIRHVVQSSQITQSRDIDGTAQSGVNQGPHLPEVELGSSRQFPADLPPREATERLIKSYFSRFHVQFPILERPLFLESVRTGSISITLLRCVLFVASIHCDTELIYLMGYKTRVAAGDDLFNKAKLSFDTEDEANRVIMLQCSFLLHYWWGQPTSFSDSLWWLSTAIRAAECMQMHRSMRNSSMSSRSKAHWKRIWWCLYVRNKNIRISKFHVLN